MADEASLSSKGMTRRGFLGLTGSSIAAGFLASCAAGGSSGGGGGSGKDLKFWDMTWGVTDAYNTDAKAIVRGFKHGTWSASYQTIAWSNFNQTFATAIASKTGPAVSSGGGFQAFQFAQQGAIAYADNLIDSFKKTGLYNDFVPGTIEAMGRRRRGTRRSRGTSTSSCSGTASRCSTRPA